MKKIILLMCSISVLMLVGCAGIGSGIYTGGAPTYAAIYTNVAAPAMNLQAPVSADASSKKIGSASSVNILGLVGFGDASLQEAMRNGGITKIHHVDHQVFNVLGIFARWTLVVHGE